MNVSITEVAVCTHVKLAMGRCILKVHQADRIATAGAQFGQLVTGFARVQTFCAKLLVGTTHHIGLAFQVHYRSPAIDEQGGAEVGVRHANDMSSHTPATPRPPPSPAAAPHLLPAPNLFTNTLL